MTTAIPPTTKYQVRLDHAEQATDHGGDRPKIVKVIERPRIKVEE